MNQIIFTQINRFLILAIFALASQSSDAQCGITANGIYYYTDPQYSNDSFYIGFCSKAPSGTFEIIDLVSRSINRGFKSPNNGANPTVLNGPVTYNQTDTSWYIQFGPIKFNDSFNIRIRKTTDTLCYVEILKGKYNITGKRAPGGCTQSAVPFYDIDFTSQSLPSLIILKRSRVLTCCSTQNQARCFELRVKLGPNSGGILLNTNGSGNEGGEIYYAKETNFHCDSVRINANGLTLCITEPTTYFIFNCKPGNNETALEIIHIPKPFIVGTSVIQPCSSFIEVHNIDPNTLVWTSQDDTSLVNLNCGTGPGNNIDCLKPTFLYDTATFGGVTNCNGRIFRYIASATGNTGCDVSQRNDTAVVIVYPDFNVTVSQLCDSLHADSLYLNADITGNGALCTYNYIWSNGETGQQIHVPLVIGTNYCVTVSRSGIASSCDKSDCHIIASPSQISCSNVRDTTISCIDLIPVVDTSLIVVTGCASEMYCVNVIENNNGGTGCPESPYILTRKYITDLDCNFSTYSDQDTCIQIFTVRDTIKPVISCPPPIIIDCNTNSTPESTGMASATDNCSDEVTNISYIDTIVLGNCVDNYTIRRTWRAVDSCNNSSSCLQIITVQDTTDPTFTKPLDITIYTDTLCVYNADTTITGIVTNETDNCSENIQATYSDSLVNGSCQGNKIIYRKWSLVDLCGNEANLQTQVVTILDTLKPTFTVPLDTTIYKSDKIPDTATIVNYDFNGGNSYGTLCPILHPGITVKVDSSSNTFETFAGTVSGTLAFTDNLNFGRSLKVDSSNIPGHWQFNISGENLVKCTDFGVYVQGYRNNNNSADTLTFTYSVDSVNWIQFRKKVLSTGAWVQDTSRIPTVANPGKLFIRISYQGGSAGANNNLYIDNFQLKSVLCCAFDASPVITGDVLNESDNCSTGLLATFCDSTVTSPCEGSSIIYRTWMLEDSCGNSAIKKVQTITVSDTSRPTFLLPPNITIYQGVAVTDTHTLVNYNFNRGRSYAELSPLLYYGINSKVDSSLNVFLTDTGTVTGPLAYAYNYKAGKALRVDTSDRAGYWQFNISGSTLELCSNFGVYVQAYKKDSLSTDTLFYQYSLNDTLYTTFNTLPLVLGSWIEDTATIPMITNVQKLFIRITYSDSLTTGPAALLIDNFQLNAIINYDSCSYDADPSITGYPINLMDNCDSIPTLSYIDTVSTGPNCSKDLLITRTWKITDDCGNSNTGVQIIEAKDSTKPFITCPPNITFTCEDSISLDSTGYATGYDFCSDTLLSLNYTDTLIAGTCPGDYSIQRTWKAKDICNNESVCVQIIDIDPIAGPFLNCVNDTTLNACQSQSEIDDAFDAWVSSVTFSGGCNSNLSNNNTGAPLACGGFTVVTFTVTSDCEPPATCSATFTVTASSVSLTCPINTTLAACSSQNQVNNAFNDWLATTRYRGGCNSELSNNNTGAPNACGGVTTVTFTITSDCQSNVTCSAIFTVLSSPVILTCASNITAAACQTQTEVDAAFNAWLSSTSVAGGCESSLSNNNTGAPSACGGTKTVTFTVTSSCEAPVTCTASFTVTAAIPVVLNCAANVTEAACQTQTQLDAAFNSWLATATTTGGCNASLSNNNTGAPDKCGGTKTVTFNVTSSCEGPVTCSATFTVTAATPVVLTCAANVTEPACQTQAQIDAAFNSWLATATTSGGCNSSLSNNNSGAPDKCGGSVTVTFTVTSSCEGPVTCSATFTVTAATPVALTCAANVTEPACQTQTQIDAAFTSWLATATTSGGCNASLNNNNSGAPDKCGGSVTVTFTVTSSCEAPVTCSATFTVTAATPVVLTCAANVTEAACQTQTQIDAAFTSWLATATTTGGCNSSLSNNNTGAPSACGGSVTVTFTVTSSCEAPVTCTATFTVTAATPVVLTCAANVTEPACQTQTQIDAAFTSWLATATTSGGCNPNLSNNNTGAPSACGGSVTVTFTVTSSCEAPVTCSATFTVTAATPVVLTCAANVTEAACQTQTQIDAAFTSWLATATTSGGCNSNLSNNNTGAPSACGGSVTVSFTVTSSCEAPVTCSATFTVTAATPVVLTCAANVTEPACQTQTQIDAAFIAWLATATTSGGCNSSLSNNNAGAPSACGGSVTVTFTVTSSCEGPVTCSATFTVTAATPVVLTCAANITEPACQTQTQIDAAFTSWLATATTSGGCNSSLSNNNTGAPDKCGGSVTVTFTVTSSCEAPVTCSATFTVTAATPVVLTCAANVTEPACQTQTQIDAAFTSWLATATTTGGCNSSLSNNNTGAPSACGGSVTVTFTVTSSCEAPVTCSATFTVTAATPVVLTCAANITEPACQTQTQIDAAFTSWLATATTSGGCNSSLSNNNSGAPDKCGGSVTVTFTVTSSCEAPVTCSATFTVTAATPVVLTCAANVTEPACQTQTQIDAAFTSWLTTATTTGGCNSSLSNNNTGAPDKCGGSVTVTFTVTSSCEAPVTCSATFTVTAATPVVLTCAANVTEAACQTQAQIDAAFTSWLATATTTGGCNAQLSNNNTGAPSACGGSVTITFTVTSSCEAPVTCSATFTVTAATPVVLNCAANVTEPACQTQTQIDAAFTSWLATATTSGGCNSSLSNNNSGAPDKCGGSVTVTFTVTSSCEAPVTCSATFTVIAATPVVLTCAANVTEPACQTQTQIDAAFTSWLTTATTTGGCNSSLSNNNSGAPDKCGGSVTVTFTVTSSCEAPVTCSATFTVIAATPVVLTCAANVTEPACQTQTQIDAAFTSWLATATTTGGCNSNLSNNNTGAPSACGGTKTVTFTVTSSCEGPITCSATFTVIAAPPVVLTCAANVTEPACQTQTQIDAAFTSWLATATTTGGCNSSLSNNNTGAPSACGGSVTVSFTVTSSCEAPVTCSATFTVTAATPVVLTCAANVTEPACQTQTQIDAAFTSWLATATTTGGCNSNLSNNNTGAPNKCGGTKTVTFTATSSCEGPITCSATFTVTAATPVVLTCAANVTEPACQTQAQIDAAFTSWLATATTSGGCNSSLSNNNTGAPSACGGSVTVTFTVTSSCEAPVTCTATFTVTAATSVVLTCAANVTEPACQTQTQIDAAFTSWLATATTSGGCNSSLSNNNTGAPSACGGTKTVTFTVTSSCEAPVTCSATFTVTAATPVALTCAANVTEPACQTQAQIDAAFTSWLATATTSGGCNSSLSNNNTGAPSACGGTKTVTFTVTSSCEAPVTCSATFTVTASTPVVLNCAANVTEAACQTQTQIDAAFTSWLATATTSGGCNSSLSNNNSGAPDKCGGSVTVTFTVTSSCEAPVTCSATFTVTAATPVVLTCAANITEPACQTQTQIDAAFTSWLATATTSGGCNASLSNNNTGAPSACGGSVTVTFTVTSSCEAPVTCSATFTVTAATPVVLTCAANVTEAACQTQTQIDAAFTAWLATATTTGGCNSNLSNNNTGAPSACGGSVTVTFTVTSSCEGPVTCSATFTVTAATPVVLTCAANVTEPACQTQTQIDAAFTSWLATATTSGGCNSSLSNNNTGAPSACGGTKTVTFTVTSNCEGPVTCSATFTVTAATPVVLTCVANITEPACQTQTQIDAAFTSWLATATTSGGCNAQVSNNNTGAPDKCGGTKTVTFTVTSSCEGPVTCSATFTVTAATPVVLTCAANITEPACQTQAQIDAAFTSWLATTTTSGGCNSSLSNNNTGAPDKCGGSVTVTFTVTSSCEGPVTCSATFTVTAATPVVLTCAANVTEPACQTQAQIDAAFTAWLATATTSGGCNSSLSNNNTGAPSACGGSVTVTFTVTSSCEAPVTCSATFTVTAATPVVLTCAANVTEPACQTQTQIDAAFTSWLATATTTGGCNSSLSNNNTGAPSACGGSVTVTFTVTSSCEGPVTCSATFTVVPATPVLLTCAANVTEPACQTQAQIDAAFTTWLATATTSGGCNSNLSNNNSGAPDKCGGSVTVTFTVTSSCEAPVTCSATFTVTAATPVVLNCAANVTEAACQTQTQIDAAFTSWLATATTTGGCNSSLSNNNTGAPSACGGSVTVTFTVTSSCEAPVTCSATFTVTAATPVVLNCAAYVTEPACQTQTQIDAAFTSWLATATTTGGCNSSLSNNNTGAPDKCGGTKTVTFTVTSSCEGPVSCSATFTVTAATPVVLTCAANVIEPACQTQTQIDAAFTSWLATATSSGGCNSSLSNNNTGAPDKCGGSVTVTFTVTSSCEGPVTCSATFTVTATTPVVLTCAANVTEPACQTQTQIDAAFTSWLATASSSGGCNAQISNNNTGAPDKCGGSVTVTFTVTSSCEGPVTCSATFTVAAATPVVLTCAANVTEPACQTQAQIDAAFTSWLATATSSGGCNAQISNNNTGAPSACGGSVTVTFTVTSSCEGPVTCSATFTVATATPVVLTCAANVTEAACQTQTQIDAAFNSWLATATSSGGCNAQLSNNNTGAPDKCGGSVTVTFTVTSSCEGPVTCSATFTVAAATPVVLTCAANVTEPACQTQTQIDAAFNSWLATATTSGGCNSSLSNNNTGAPDKCGGTKTVTFTVTSSCEGPVTCSATFTVAAATPVVLTCAANVTEPACQTQAQIDAAFTSWLATATTTGGCNTSLSNNNTGAPDKCGGTKTVTFTVTSSCEGPVTCSATFIVTTATPVVLTCAANVTEPACQTQAQIDAAFTAWLATATSSGGCNSSLSNNNTGAPDKCGGSVTVTFTVTSSCEAPVTCSATFTVTAATSVVLTCAGNVTEAACQTQAQIDAAFTSWLATATTSGGCNSSLSNNNSGAPDKCGESVTVTFTVTSSCEGPVTCSATFTVAAATPVVLTCAANVTEPACQTQAQIDAAFTSWLATATTSGGCNSSLSNNNTGAPDKCGGSVTVTFTVTSSCEAPVTCGATFTVAAATPVVLTCAANVTEPACQTQAEIDAAFNSWLATATSSGGCNAQVSNNNSGAPSACGGSVTVTFTVTSSCEGPVTCSATFTVTAATPVALTCAANVTEPACQTQAQIDAAFNSWLATATTTGGCNSSLSNNNTGAPSACGGSVTVTFTVTSSCEAPVTCSATFTVTAATPVVLTCAANVTEAACQTQTQIDAAFTSWLATTTTTGGCNSSLSNNNSGAPSACGGSVTVTFTVTSSCEAPVTCSATFTVTAATPVVLTCAANVTEAACQTQTQIDAAFNSWLATATTSGGCNAGLSNNNSGAPSACGGSVTVTFTVTSSCEAPVTCSATFTVTAATPVVLTCAVNVTEPACQTQTQIDAAFNSWLATATSSGGCNAQLSNNNTGAPDKCGGSVTVTFTVTSSCEAPVTCTASFTVTAATPVVLTCAANVTEPACQTQTQIDAAFTSWLATATNTGGCNSSLSNNNTGAPSACGGSVTVTFTVTSSCEGPVTCSATFTVTAATPVVLNCAANVTEAACQTQTQIDAAFNSWLATATTTGGCNSSLSNNNSGAPSACGGSVTVTFTVTSSCEGPVTCSATFTVTAATPVVLTCAANVTEPACQTQAQIDAAFNSWLATATTSGGCNSSLSNNNTGAPDKCGGSVTVTFTVTSSCEAPVTCSATFTVIAATPVVLTCAANVTEPACQTQTQIDAAFTSWLATATTSGGCNSNLSNNNTGAPDKCGGSVTVTFTVTSSCEGPVTCSATFIVTAATPVVLTCAANVTQPACQTQTQIDAAFTSWLATATTSGGCNSSLSNNNTGAPDKCGGSVTVTFTVTSSCEGPVTCSATFTVTAATAVVLTCAANVTEPACQTQTQIDAAFTSWLATATNTGGCNSGLSNNNTGAPDKCGGSVTVTFTVTSSCEAPVTCSATFTVTAATPVVLTCAANVTEPACQTQTQINAAFTSWLATATSSGGCNAQISNNNTGAPDKCGGSVTVTFTVTSSCEGPVTCSATFTVAAATPVVLTCAANVTEPACQTQTQIDAAFNSWLATSTSSGGCNAQVSNNNSGAPSACGGSVTVTFTVTSSCEGPISCSATFTVAAATPIVLTCAANVTEAACQTQAQIDAAFNSWLATATTSGGCNSSLSNNNTGAPSACGGSVTVTFTVTSSCEGPVTCSATFTVVPATPVLLTCAANVTEPACQTQAQIDAAFTTWLATATTSGGCNSSLSNNNTGAPSACGGSVTVTFTVTSSCEVPVTCSATFTVIAATPVVLTCAANVTEAACQTQAQIDAAFTAWLATATASGGCNSSLSNNNTGAPDKCGGSVTVTFTVTSSCEQVSCSAVFTVSDAPAIILTCPGIGVEAACHTQTQIDAAFTSWLTTATTSGGCNSSLSNNNTGAPDKCGGSVTVTFTVTSSCEGPVTCSATFTVTAATPVVLTCAANVTEAACQTQTEIDTAFTSWLATATTSGGCNSSLSNNNSGAPDKCGGNVSVTFTVTSSCEGLVTCSATFTVAPATPIELTCAANVTEPACQTQAQIDAAFSSWLATTTTTGGCNAQLSNNNTGAPNKCGGSVTVTFTVTSSCEGPVTCSATFTVTTATPVVLTCAVNVTEAACQTQAQIDAAFTSWLATTTTSGGCNAQLSNNSTDAPSACGGTITVTFIVTSSCEGPVTCSATFTVTAATPVVLTCAANVTEPACQTQAQIDAAFNSWLATATTSGGCNAQLSNNNTGAPNKCGGIVTVTFTVTSSCEGPVTCSATFTVTATTPVVLTCAANVIEPACQKQSEIDQLFNDWLNTVSVQGGCNTQLSNNNNGSPSRCGGSKTVIFTATTSCEPAVTCSATFIVESTVLDLICPQSITVDACYSQEEINDLYSDWLTSVQVNGGCDVTIKNNSQGPPSACGGVKRVTFTATSSCNTVQTCLALFEVLSIPEPIIICPDDITINCDESQLPSHTGYAGGADGCNEQLEPTYRDSILQGRCEGNYLINRTWKIKDKCNHEATCLQIITVVDPYFPTFNVPADVTIYKKTTLASARVIVNYNFNKGATYNSLEPRVATGITSIVDTSSVPYSTSTGVATGSNAFENNLFAGKSLIVYNSEQKGHWQFNIGGRNLKYYKNFEVYVQAFRKGNGSARNLLFDYSIDGGTWTNFAIQPLIKGSWVECYSSLFGVEYVKSLKIRVTYSGGNSDTTKELLIDNFQVKGWNDEIQCDFDDSPTITGYPTNISHPCDASPAVTYVDALDPGACITEVARIWTVTDFCGNATTAPNPQHITVLDTTGPQIICHAGSSQSRKADSTKCYYTVKNGEFDAKATKICSDTIYLTNDFNNDTTLNGEEIPVGIHTITWTATDACGNSAVCKFTVTIFETEPPNAICKDISIFLDANGKYVLDTTDVDNGSWDNCKIKSFKLNRRIFGCDDIPYRDVIMTVTDSSGLMDTCHATVFISDTIKPTVTCKNIIISLPPSKTYIINPDSVIHSKFDNCGIVTTIVTPYIINCNSDQVTTVIVVVTDASGNSGTCLATVTIRDYIDSDCDGVIDVCDECPGGDDNVDENGDGRPDCNYPPNFRDVKNSWKCGFNPDRVYIADIGLNGRCTTKCVSYNLFITNRQPNQFLGPCQECPEYVSNPDWGADKKSNDAYPRVTFNDPIEKQVVDPIHFTIVPNPNFGQFDLILEKEIEEGSFHIFNLLGSEVWTHKVINKMNRLSINTNGMNQFTSSVYRVMLKTKNGKTFQSLLIMQY